MNGSNSFLVEEAYRKHGPALYAFILCRVSSAADASDLLHDVFLRLLEYQGMIVAASLRSLLYAMARNVVCDYFRRQKVRNCLEAGEEAFGPQDIQAAEGADSRLAASELSMLETRKLASMPSRRRRVYILSRFEYLKPDEIAGIMNLSKRTVENHIYMGVREMRAYISAVY